MLTNIFDQFIPISFYKTPIRIAAGIIALTWTLFLQRTHWANRRWNLIKESLELIFNKLLKSSKAIQGLWRKWLLTTFILVLRLKVCRLIPYTFASTSHLRITFSLSIPLWLSVQIIGILFNWKSKIRHLVPSGTPSYLIPFMVLIETTRLLIQPLTLGFRLGANLLAGHLLIFLCSCVVWTVVLRNIIGILSFILLFALFALEIAVAFIQARVFLILTKQYLEDNIH